ncbi:DUF6221 family protein [Streptosporangium sp. NPDC004379]|uniref:DUF6221 family protein n=1 Tax=Streptosporangium sp. NPDC004379 TaxID=3366189 RepID=UPI0036BBAEC6
MDELIMFLRRRIDEDEREWRSPPRKLRSMAAKMLGDVETRRQMIDRISNGERTHDDLLTLMALAGRYFDHPDFQSKWWTYPD